jgi:hypothetical protein
MCRLAAILFAILPLAAGAQNEPAAAARPDFMVEIKRTPERDIEQALRRVSSSIEEDNHFGVTNVGLEATDYQRFSEIAVRARTGSQENAIQGAQRFCDDRESLSSREVLLERLLAATESEQAPWDEAVEEVFATFSTEAVNSLIRTTAAWNYSGVDMDYEKYFQVQDLEVFLEETCVRVEAAIESGQF